MPLNYLSKTINPKFIFTPTVVPPDTNYIVSENDRCLLISTTMAGVNTITLGTPNNTNNVFQLVILMTAANIGTYSVSTTIVGSGITTFVTTNQTRTYFYFGNGTWAVI